MKMRFLSNCLFLYCTIAAILVVINAAPFDQRIQSGYIPKHSEFSKYIVSLQLKRRDGQFKASKFFGGFPLCGGSILSERVILTAAHCVCYGKTTMPFDLITHPLQIVAGTRNLLKLESTTQKRRVQNIVVHPDFSDDSTPFQDLALLFLKHKLVLDNKSLGIVKLSDEAPLMGTSCLALGWGQLYLQGPQAADLTFVNLTVQAQEKCPTSSKAIICLGDEENFEASKGFGDSGGPLICNGKLAGVASFVFFNIPLYAEFEKPRYSFYANVSEHKNWILQSLENSAACKNFRFIVTMITLQIVQRAFF